MNRTRCRMVMLAMVSLSTFVAVPGRCSAAVRIARDGQAEATIVHDNHLEQAKALQTYLEKITGAAIPAMAELAAGDAYRPCRRII